jgi:hypothetical protein
MARAGYHLQVTDAAGNIVPSAAVEVRRLTSGLPLVQLYDSREGGAALGNPFTAEADGSAVFYVSPGGAFRITARKVIEGDLWEKVIPYAAIATGAEYDFDTLFSTVDLPGLVHLLHNDEVASAEHASSAAESAALKTFSLPANDYTKIKIEAVVRSRVEQDANTKSTFTWRFKEAGVAVDNGTFTQQIIASSTTGQDGGDRLTATLSVIIDGGQASTTALTITAQNSVSNSAIGSLVHSFRVYGIRDSAVSALLGTRDVFVLNAAISGRPRAGEIIEGHKFVDPVTFEDLFEGSEFSARVDATDDAEVTITQNDTPVATVTYPGGGGLPVAAGTGLAFDIADEFDLIMPDPRDPTLAGLKMVFRGRRQT